MPAEFIGASYSIRREGSHRSYAHVACAHSCGISDALARITPCAERAVIGHMRMLHACTHAVFLMLLRKLLHVRRGRSLVICACCMRAFMRYF